MKTIFYAFLIFCFTKAEINKNDTNGEAEKNVKELKEDPQQSLEDLNLQQNFMDQLTQMYNQLPEDFGQKNELKRSADSKEFNQELQSDKSKFETEPLTAKAEELQKAVDSKPIESKNLTTTSTSNKSTDTLSQNLPEELPITPIQQNFESKKETLDLKNETPLPVDNYSVPVFIKPLAKSYSDARKLGDDDKMEDIEKRLFSIEDKIDHLLMHAGHDLTPHKLTWTPWGMHIMPSYHNPDSMHHKLAAVDHIFGMGGHLGGAGMGMMGYGMGMMGHPMGGYGSMYGMGMGHHMMGIGHLNPYGYGLNNINGGWNHFDVTGLGRRASYPGSSNPYYTGNGTII